MSKEGRLEEEVAKIVAFAGSGKPDSENRMTINGNNNIQIAGDKNRPMTINGHRNLQISGPSSALRRFFNKFNARYR